MREINQIIVHCADTPANMNVGAKEIRHWHVFGNGWSDIGYHYVIRRNGEVERGREDARVGAHCRGQNKDSIGICMVGGREYNNFTNKQWEALNKLIGKKMVQYHIMLHNIKGHYEYDSGKKCPNFNMDEYREHLLDSFDPTGGRE